MKLIFLQLSQIS